MTLHGLQLFARLAKNPSITRVSRELHISQSAVSHQLKDLQQYFNVVLLRKNGRGIELTEDGRRFLREAEPVVSGWERLEQKYRGKSYKRGKDSLALGGSVAHAAVLLPSLVGWFKGHWPSVQAFVRSGTNEEIQRLLLAGTLDAGFAVNPPPSPLLHAERFSEEKLIPFVRRDHPFARRRAVNLAVIAESPVVIRREFNRRNWTLDYLTKLQNDHFKWKNLMYCDSFDAVKRAVRAADCVGIMHEDLLHEDLQRREFKFLKLNDTALTVQNFLCYSTENPLSPVAEKFVSLLRATRASNLEVGGQLPGVLTSVQPGSCSSSKTPAASKRPFRLPASVQR